MKKQIEFYIQSIGSTPSTAQIPHSVYLSLVANQGLTQQDVKAIAQSIYTHPIPVVSIELDIDGWKANTLRNRAMDLVQRINTGGAEVKRLSTLLDEQQAELVTLQDQIKELEKT